MELNIKSVTVNGIVSGKGAALEGKTAMEAVIDVAEANQINSFNVSVDGDTYSRTAIREVGTDWTEICIQTSEKPSCE